MLCLYSLDSVCYCYSWSSAKKFGDFYNFYYLFVSVVLMYVIQMKERSIQTLGYLPVGDGDFPHQKKLLQGLMDSVEVRKMYWLTVALTLVVQIYLRV